MLHSISILKGECVILFIGDPEASKYDMLWTENGDLIDSFIPEILSFKECSKCVHHVSRKEAIDKIFVFSPINASNSPYKIWRTLTLML